MKRSAPRANSREPRTGPRRVDRGPPAQRSSRRRDRRGRGPRWPNKLLVIGTIVLVSGAVLLAVTLGRLRLPAGLWPVPPLVAGLVLLYLAWPRGGSRRWIVPGMLLTLGGLFFLLVETVLGWDRLPRVWPAFMLITGCALIPYGMRLSPRARVGILIPAAFIFGLGLFLFPFALAGSRGSLAAFVVRWWPLALVAAGLILLVSFYGTRKPNRMV